MQMKKRSIRFLISFFLFSSAILPIYAYCSGQQAAEPGTAKAPTNRSPSSTRECPDYTPPEESGDLTFAKDPCLNEGTKVLAYANQRALFLCENGRAVRSYAIAIGTGGINKKVEGDGKTPIGVYPLSAPRASAKFGTFIPVGYPTDAERRAAPPGTDLGKAIGIHGPARDTRCFGFLNVSFDWTDGCLAVASDTLINEIASWVKQHPGVVIRIANDQRNQGDADPNSPPKDPQHPDNSISKPEF